MLFVDEDAAADDELLPLAVMRAAGDVADDSVETGREEDQSVGSVVDETTEGGGQTRLIRHVWL